MEDPREVNIQKLQDKCKYICFLRYISITITDWNLNSMFVGIILANLTFKLCRCRYFNAVCTALSLDLNQAGNLAKLHISIFLSFCTIFMKLLCASHHAWLNGLLVCEFICFRLRKFYERFIYWIMEFKTDLSLKEHLRTDTYKHSVFR